MTTTFERGEKISLEAFVPVSGPEVINSKMMTSLRPEIEEALEELGEKYGIKFSVGNGSYGNNAGHFKLEMSVVRPDGVVLTKERTNFVMYAEMYGLKKTDVDREFSHNGRKLKIIGIKVKTKCPVLCRDQKTGTVYKYPVELVKKQLGSA